MASAGRRPSPLRSFALFISLAALVTSGPIAARAHAQSAGSTRLAILIAEDRRAPTARDLATIRGALHGRDPETARIAVRALGRLERPELIPDIASLLKSSLPEIRAEAATAMGQAAQGWNHARTVQPAPAVRRAVASSASDTALNSAAAAVLNRLKVEDEPSVRAALADTLGRLPYTTGQQVQQAESALLETLGRDDSVEGRLGVAQGFESLIRLHKEISPPSDDAIKRLTELVSGSQSNGAARIRRLALEALTAANRADERTLARAIADSDAQVRRLAVRAASMAIRPDQLDAVSDIVQKGLADPIVMVRIEAMRRAPCAAAITAVADHETHVALTAIDRLQACRTPEAVDLLAGLVADTAAMGLPRGWHRAAHAIVALAAANPERARAALPALTASSVWQVRMYAARAAAVLNDRATLEKLAADGDDNVCEAAIAGLSRSAGHAADDVYVAALTRRGYQVIREAARALASGSGAATASDRGGSTAIPAIQATLDRLVAEGHDNSHDARAALADALEKLGGGKPAAQAFRAHDRVAPAEIDSEINAEDLRRLATARARITIRGAGVFELALFPAQAPATTLRFAKLAESGYYNGLTFHRVVPDFVIQGGSPGANEYIGDASFMRDEVGLWPHVRGAVGISTRGRDTGDAQIFIDLVDNPRLDHEYTVFAQVLNGMDVVDQVLEGDVVDKVEILTQ